MIGAIIGDLAAWTWKNDHDQFYPYLITDRAQLSAYGIAVLYAARENLHTSRRYDISGLVMDLNPDNGWIKYTGQWLMWQIVAAWMAEDNDDYPEAHGIPDFHSIDKEEYYAKTFITQIIKKLRAGISKTETFEAVHHFNNLIHTWHWKTPEGDDSILAHLFRAWDSFYRGFDLTSSLHNAMKWSGDRHLTAVLTGTFAGAMYGCDHILLKEKYTPEHYVPNYLRNDVMSILSRNAKDTPLLIHDMDTTAKRIRSFFPKNNALTNVERHHFTHVCNPYESIVFSNEEHSKILRAFYTDWDNRYGFYLDDGWVYSNRSGYLIGRFKLTFHSDGWRISELQNSGERVYKDLLIAICEALYSCGIGSYPIHNCEDIALSLKYFDGREDAPELRDTTKGKFWFGEKMFLTTKQDLNYWTSYAKDTRKKLTSAKRAKAKQLDDRSFGIVLYIETLFGKFCPFDDFKWIYDYGVLE